MYIVFSTLHSNNNFAGTLGRTPVSLGDLEARLFRSTIDLVLAPKNKARQNISARSVVEKDFKNYTAKRFGVGDYGNA